MILDPKRLPPGEEQWVLFNPPYPPPNRQYVQYDYRAQDGELFSWIAPNLAEARNRRDKWVRTRKGKGGACLLSLKKQTGKKP